jgi:spore germination protein KC
MEHVELNKLGIVAGIAIDKIDDKYIVNTQIINPSAIAGETQNTLPIYSLEAEGSTIQEAYQKLDQITSSVLFLSHLNVIVINEAFAESGISPLLNFALRHAEVRPDINIVVAKGERAGDVLNVVTALDMIPAAQLNISSRVSKRTGRLIGSNLYEVVDMVNTNAINVVLNAVTIYRNEEHLNENIQQKEDTKGKTKDNGSTIDNILDIANPVQLRIEHLAVFQGEKLVGYIDSYEAQLYNMIMGDHKKYVVVTKIEEDYYTSAKIDKIESNITTDLTNNEATIEIKLDAMIVENTYPIDLTNSENLVAISTYLQKQVEQDMKNFIGKVQTELKSDIFGIGGQTYYQENKVWQEKEGYWSDIFPELKINVKIELEVDSIGEIGNVTV